MSNCLYGVEALRRFREQRGQIDGPAEPVPVEDDEHDIAPADDRGDDFDDLFDAWVDFNMERAG